MTAGSFRLATALFGHAGIEHDLTSCTDDELALITAWPALHRELRPLLHSGVVVRADLPDDQVLLHGVVAQDGSRALYCWARLGTSPDAQSGRVRLPGLAAGGTYGIRVRTELGTPSLHQIGGPRWLDEALGGWVRVPGAVPAAAGLPMPTLDPEQALLLEVRREHGDLGAPGLGDR